MGLSSPRELSTSSDLIFAAILPSTSCCCVSLKPSKLPTLPIRVVDVPAPGASTVPLMGAGCLGAGAFGVSWAHTRDAPSRRPRKLNPLLFPKISCIEKSSFAHAELTQIRLALAEGITQVVALDQHGDETIVVADTEYHQLAHALLPTQIALDVQRRLEPIAGERA